MRRVHVLALAALIIAATPLASREVGAQTRALADDPNADGLRLLLPPTTSREAGSHTRCAVVDPHVTCCGCSVSPNVRIFLPTPRPKEWGCRIRYEPGIHIFESVTINEGFSLGKIGTSSYWVRFQPTRTGTDTVTVTLNRRDGRTNAPCKTTIRYNITVVDGKAF
jgi:hypothetical protein